MEIDYVHGNNNCGYRKKCDKFVVRLMIRGDLFDFLLFFCFVIHNFLYSFLFIYLLRVFLFSRDTCRLWLSIETGKFFIFLTNLSFTTKMYFGFYFFFFTHPQFILLIPLFFTVLSWNMRRYASSRNRARLKNKKCPAFRKKFRHFCFSTISASTKFQSVSGYLALGFDV